MSISGANMSYLGPKIHFRCRC